MPGTVCQGTVFRFFPGVRGWGAEQPCCWISQNSQAPAFSFPEAFEIEANGKGLSQTALPSVQPCSVGGTRVPGRRGYLSHLLCKSVFSLGCCVWYYRSTMMPGKQIGVFSEWSWQFLLCSERLGVI